MESNKPKKSRIKVSYVFASDSKPFPMDVYIDERDLAGEKTLKQALTELTGRWKNFLNEEHTTVEYFTLSSTCTIRVRNVYSIMIVEGWGSAYDEQDQ